MKDPSIIALEEWARSSAETLGTLLGQAARPGEARSYIVTPTELGSIFPKGAFLMPLTLNAALMGPIVLAVDGDAALRLSASMLAEEEPPESLTPLHAEVLGEAIKQMASFLGGTLGRAMGHEVSVHEGDAVFGSLPDLGAPLYVAAEFPIKIMGEGQVSLHLVLPAGLAEELSQGAAANGFVESQAAEARAAQAAPGTDGAEAQSTALASPTAGDSRHTAAQFDAIQGAGHSSGDNTAAPLASGMEMLLDVPLEVMAVLGSTSLMIEELLTIGEGSVLELDKLAGEPIELFVKDRLIAVGEVVVIDERFGVKILEMVSGRRNGKALAAGF